jgi:four helix bundle protein
MVTTSKKSGSSAPSYHELPVWKVSVDLAVIIYKMTSTFPEQHNNGISEELKRGVLDICAGIAQGYQKSAAFERSNELVKVVEMTYRLESLLYVAARLGLLSGNVLVHYTGVLTEIRNMIGKFIRGAKRNEKAN